MLDSLQLFDVCRSLALSLLLKHDLSAVLELLSHLVLLLGDSLDKVLVLLKLTQFGGLPLESLLLERILISSSGWVVEWLIFVQLL